MESSVNPGNPFGPPIEQQRAFATQELKPPSTTEKVARIGFNWSTLAVFGTGTLTGVGLSLGLASLVLLLGSANPIFFPLGIGALICLAISTVLIVIGSCRELCRS